MDEDPDGRAARHVQPDREFPSIDPLISNGTGKTFVDDPLAPFISPHLEEIDPQLLREQKAVMLRPGDVVAGRFEVLGQLGFGGMGAVYHVRDRALGTERALKVMLPSLLESRSARERFLSEITISQRLNHDGIVRVHDLGRDSTRGLQFLTMELVEGKTLHRLLHEREGKLPVSEALDIAQQLCDALDYAHQYTIHRDLKPQNIMIRPDGRIKVLDFGLAKLLSPGRLTKSSMALGTAYYQAPEQSVHLRELDQRADIYSLGVILYQMLTGQIPLGMTKPPSRVNRAVPKTLDKIIGRCLAPQAEERYDSAKPLKKALNNVRPRRRAYARWVLAAIGLLALLSGAYLAPHYVTWYGREIVEPPPEPPPPPDPPRVDALNVDRAREGAENLRNAALAKGAEEHAPELVASATQLLQRAGGYAESGDFEGAVGAYEDAGEKFAEAGAEADLKIARTETLETSRSAMLRAKAEADAVDANRWAEWRYLQAEVLEEQAEGVTDPVTARELYDRAAQEYGLARDETISENEAMVSAARQAAENARARADTEDVLRYAKAEWDEAEALIFDVGEPGLGVNEIYDRYHRATALYEDAVRVAESPRPPPPPPPTQEPLRLSSRSVKVSASNPSVSVAVMLGTQPASSSSIQDASIDANYRYMFDVTRSSDGPARVTVAMKPAAETGTYRLTVRADNQTAHVNVEVEAATAPPPPGLQLPRFQLDSSYQETSVLTYTVDEPRDLDYVWMLNDREVLSGIGRNVLEVCLHELGRNTLTLILRQGNTELGRASATTNVVPVRPLVWDVWTGAENVISDGLPEGYRQYRWEIDGVEVSRDRALKHRFTSEGRYRIDGYAQNPISPSERRTHVRVTYDTTARNYR